MDGAVYKVGDAPLRREDARFVAGAGRYLDDLAFDGLAYAAFVRSPYAHAAVESVDVDAAKNMPGVLGAFTAIDLALAGLKRLEPFARANTVTGEAFACDDQPLLAESKVRFAGEPVAMIVAESKAAAMDAAEAVDVSYTELPAVTDGLEAIQDGAPELSAEVPGNLCMDWTVGDLDAIDDACDAAAHVVEVELFNQRVVTNPMEPRGGVGVYDPETDRFTLHACSQNVHGNRDFVAAALGIAPEKMRWVAPDVGGGFGAKNFAYVEQALLPWAAKRIGRPVKWVASRSEVFLADHQARDHHATAKLALNAAGRFLALEIDSVANLGAYMIGNAGSVHTNQYAHLPNAVYAIPNLALRVRTALSNTAPIGVTRAPGFAEINNIMERLIELAADATGIDRFELRRLNFTPAAAMPATNSFGTTVDSGDFAKAFDAALARADAEGFADRRAAATLPRGFGVACHIKATGGSPDENVEIQFPEDGGIALVTGTQTIGQGHETTFPQMVAERLGVPNRLIRLVHGDTDAIPIGGGHGSSRATYMAGTAIWQAAEEVVEKGKIVAGDMLEAAASDLAFDDGRFVIAGTDRAVDLLEVAAKARVEGRPLDAYYAFTRTAMTYPSGAHVAEVEVDPDTGVVRLLNYVAVDDYGVLVNPTIVKGQTAGAIAQGVGQALLEQAVYDGGGQLIAGSFMDYALPRADDLPSFDISFSPTRCTTNPFGVKGCGEGGAIAGYPAVTLAILDALKPYGVTGWTGAATPEAVWRAIQAAAA